MHRIYSPDRFLLQKKHVLATNLNSIANLTQWVESCVDGSAKMHLNNEVDRGTSRDLVRRLNQDDFAKAALESKEIIRYVVVENGLPSKEYLNQLMFEQVQHLARESKVYRIKEFIQPEAFKIQRTDTKTPYLLKLVPKR